jgi:hypothetical protein
VFSTFLYTGTGTGYAGNEQNIINGIDVSGKGALIWIKARGSTAAYNSYWNRHQLYDTNRGITFALNSNTTDAHGDTTDSMSTRADGFRLASGGSYYQQNFSGVKYVSWTFRQEPKFFDIVTYTGDGTSPRAISHNLGSAPGCVIIKQTNAVNDWCVWHTATGNDKSAALNLTDGFATFAQRIKSVTSTTFSVGNSSTVNDSGATYVAYLFAHNAGGFGLTGNDNVISFGIAYSNSSVNLGFEPQWILDKDVSSGYNWNITDNMRGDGVQSGNYLRTNTADIEGNTGSTYFLKPTATGFDVPGSYATGSGFIYIAIRKGPMKVPTVGTSVFSPEVQTPGGGFFTAAANSGFPIDWLPTRQKGVVTDWYQTSRLTNNYMSPNTTATEAAYTYGFDLMQGVRAEWSTNATVSYAFRRAPGFFDVVAYTGSVAGGVLNHNLGVAPQLMIFKSRASTSDNNWSVQCAFGPSGKVHNLNGTGQYNGTLATSLTASSITLTDNTTNNTVAYVAYLFATCPGVSKVGSYTGTGTTLQIDCGFTTGARFVLIKRADAATDWYVWDTVRGIISGNDPYLLMNSTAAEVTNTDYIDSYSPGFELSSTAPAALNANGGTYIFLAIA